MLNLRTSVASLLAIGALGALSSAACNSESMSSPSPTNAEKPNASRTTSAPATTLPPSMVQGPAGLIFVDDGGTAAPAVVFIHSFAGSSGHWAAQLEHLRPARRALALDLRGHGRSAAPPGTDAYGVEALKGDLEAVVQQRDLGRIVLVGHSLGGAVAIAYAGSHPDQVAGLMIVGTPGKSTPAEASKVLTSMQTDFEPVMTGYWTKLMANARPEVAARLERERRSLPPDVSIALTRGIFEYDPLPALKAYTGPVLMVDTSAQQSLGSLHGERPDIPQQIITGTSHWPHMDKPAEFNRVLDAFLAKAR
jgi:pimeloyl-ACP methyl ester carboxylesterase